MVQEFSDFHLRRFAIHTNPNTKYFVIRSNNTKNVALSVECGVWATPRKNEQVLNAAFNSAAHVILFFSVVHSNAFQGYARMCSRIGGSRKQNPFVEPGRNPWGQLFEVEWLGVANVDHREIQHLQSADGDKLVTCRDGQAVGNEAGRQVAALIDKRVSKERSEVIVDIPKSLQGRSPSRSPGPVKELQPLDFLHISYDNYVDWYKKKEAGGQFWAPALAGLAVRKEKKEKKVKKDKKEKKEKKEKKDKKDKKEKKGK
mmetsp:Transcript_51071/g.111903  ORF Transcript_51071/g.111903 Transcript_51071/m.111903 type:complete len:258 (+) Transcript_51071:51-824(+)